MTRELMRRLASLEAAHPAVTLRRPLTEDDRTLLTAVEAMAIALISGKWITGDDPRDALHRGMEKALYRMDCLSPLRYAFARRFDEALNISLNACESVACPIDKRERLLAIRRTAVGSVSERSFMDLRGAHTSFQHQAHNMDLLTIIGSDGAERYRWPERAGTDAPKVGWQGQGSSAAVVYWSKAE